jgi:hypothetical protein
MNKVESDTNNKVKDYVLNDYEEHYTKSKLPKIHSSKILVESAMTYYPESNRYHGDNIRIIEVKNNKVIKQTNAYSEGRIVYKIPDIMKVRSTYKVLVRISKSKASVSIYDSLSGDIRTSKIPITENMEVKLVDVSPKDDKAFDIEELDNAIQMVENGDTYTEWSWGVTPIRVGSSNLKVVVSVIHNDSRKDVVYEDAVKVERDIPVQTMFFIKKYWQVFLTSIIIPFTVWFYKKRKKKKDDEKTEKEDGES